jgi:hypothetical protein
MPALQNSDQASPFRMSPVIKITAGESVRYSKNNGITMSEFDDNEFYEVPQHVARGMLARGWAKLVNLGGPGGQPGEEPPPAPKPPAEEPQPSGEPPEKEHENGDGPAPEPEQEQSALRARGKRR